MPSRRRRQGQGSRTRQPRAKRTQRYSDLTGREIAIRERALGLLSDLRRGVGSYTALLQKYHLDTRTAHRYLGRDLHGGTDGRRVRASRADRRVREVMFPQSFGDVPIRTRSSHDATRLSQYYHDRDRLFRGKMGRRDFEAKWRGVVVAGREVFADAAKILGMADADVLKLETLYASTGGAR